MADDRRALWDARVSEPPSPWGIQEPPDKKCTGGRIIYTVKLKASLTLFFFLDKKPPKTIDLQQALSIWDNDGN